MLLGLGGLSQAVQPSISSLAAQVAVKQLRWDGGDDKEKAALLIEDFAKEVICLCT